MEPEAGPGALPHGAGRPTPTPRGQQLPCVGPQVALRLAVHLSVTLFIMS